MYILVHFKIKIKNPLLIQILQHHTVQKKIICPSHQNKQVPMKRRTRSNTQKLKATNDAITHLTQNIRLVISNFI